MYCQDLDSLEDRMLKIEFGSTLILAEHFWYVIETDTVTSQCANSVNIPAGQQAAYHRQ